MNNQRQRSCSVKRANHPPASKMERERRHVLVCAQTLPTSGRCQQWSVTGYGVLYSVLNDPSVPGDKLTAYNLCSRTGRCKRSSPLLSGARLGPKASNRAPLLGIPVQTPAAGGANAAWRTLKKDAAHVPLTGAACEPGPPAHDTTTSNLQHRLLTTRPGAPTRHRRNHGPSLRRRQPEYAPELLGLRQRQYRFVFPKRCICICAGQFAPESLAV